MLSLYEKFKETPMYLAFVKDTAAGTQAERRLLVTRRAELLAEQQTATAALDERLAGATKKRNVAKATYDKAEADVKELLTKKHHVARTASVAVDKTDRELRQLADPRIAQALAELNDRAAALMSADIKATEIQTAKIDTTSGRRVVVCKTNAAGRRDVLVAIRAARHHLSELHLAAPDDVVGAIDAILLQVPWGRLDELESADDGPRAA